MQVPLSIHPSYEAEKKDKRKTTEKIQRGGEEVFLFLLHWLLFHSSSLQSLYLTILRAMLFCLMMKPPIIIIKLNHSSIRKAPNSRDKPVLCLHITENLAKSPFWMVPLGKLLLRACCKYTSYVLISSIKSIKNAKDKIVFLDQQDYCALAENLVYLHILYISVLYAMCP